MANINVSSPSNFVTLTISSTLADLTTNDTTNTGTLTISTSSQISVPALQDITVTNQNGTFRWVQLDNTSRRAVATPATNSLNFNIVLDDKAFFGDTGTAAKADGLFKLSNNKTPIYFKFTWGGGSTNYVVGSGFLVGLAPKVAPDTPVWMSPLAIEVDGKYYTNA